MINLKSTRQYRRRPQAVRVRESFTGLDISRQDTADLMARNVIMTAGLVEIMVGIALILISARGVCNL